LGFAVRKLKDFGSESSGAGLFEDLFFAWCKVSSDVGRNWRLKSRNLFCVGLIEMIEMKIWRFFVLERGCGFFHFVYKINKIS
jgi:hypothetical protein